MEADFDQEMEAFSALKAKFGLSTVWSIYDIKSYRMNRYYCPEPIKSIEYSGWGREVRLEFNRKLTALEMWQAADKLILDSGDLHHIFIENFKETSPGHYDLITGS